MVDEARTEHASIENIDRRLFLGRNFRLCRACNRLGSP